VQTCPLDSAIADPLVLCDLHLVKFVEGPAIVWAGTAHDTFWHGQQPCNEASSRAGLHSRIRDARIGGEVLEAQPLLRTTACTESSLAAVRSSSR